MRFALGALVLVFNFLDNATTFACLSSPVPGFDVFEANPVARWLFDGVGLAPGLLIETLLTTAAVGFLVTTRRLSPRARAALLVVLALLPAWAAAHNFQVMQELDIGWPARGIDA